MPTIILIGYPQSGKTLAAKMISALTRSPYGETSDVVYSALADKFGVTVRELRKIPKEILRPRLVEMGDELCRADPATLSRSLYQSGFRIISGIRRICELRRFSDDLTAAGGRVCVIWLERPAPRTRDNTTVRPSDADYVVRNDGTLVHLWEQLEKIVDSLATKTGESHPTNRINHGQPK